MQVQISAVQNKKQIKQQCNIKYHVSGFFLMLSLNLMNIIVYLALCKLCLADKYDIDKIENKSNSDKTIGEIRCFFDEKVYMLQLCEMTIQKMYDKMDIDIVCQ